MTILITGATGFVGSHLVEYLLTKNLNIVVVVRNKNKIPMKWNNLVSVIESDLNIPEQIKILREYIQKKNVTTIVHLAAKLDFYGNRKALYNINVGATVNLLNLGAEVGVKKYIFASSIESIGPVPFNLIPADEDTIPSPVSNYGRSKLLAETEIKHCYEKKSCPAIAILRFGNIYGPGSKFLIPALAKSIVRNSELTSLRVFWANYVYNPIFIDDVIEILYLFILRDLKGLSVYNVAGREYLPLENLYENIAEIIAKPLPPSYINMLKRQYLFIRKSFLRQVGLCDTITYFISGDGDRVHRAFSIKKLQQEYNFTPKINIQEGIRRTLTYWQNDGGYDENSHR